MAQLIHPELSYEIRGVMLDVYNKLGPMLEEEYYRDAVAIGLEKRRLLCETEKPFDVCYQGTQVGLYYVDAWIDNGKIILEFKVAPQIEPLHQAQALSYLKVTNADLAIVANYGASSFEDHRLPNFLRDKRAEFVWEPFPATAELLYPDIAETLYRSCQQVHFTLGPGFLHQVYRRATLVELRQSGLGYEYLKQLPVEYEGQLLGYQAARLIIVEKKVLLAVFALRQTEATAVEQLRARMRCLDLNLGLLANFYGTRLNITPVRLK